MDITLSAIHEAASAVAARGTMTHESLTTQAKDAATVAARVTSEPAKVPHEPGPRG